jgi:hypothetical protein
MITERMQTLAGITVTEKFNKFASSIYKDIENLYSKSINKIDKDVSSKLKGLKVYNSLLGKELKSGVIKNIKVTDAVSADGKANEDAPKNIKVYVKYEDGTEKWEELFWIEKV